MKKRLTNGTLSRLILMLLMMVTGITQGVAQNVTIDLVHGSLLAAVTDQTETGFGAGFKALWRHEQLALSMTGTDRDAITETGEIAQPSAVFGERNGKIVITGGRRPSFIVVSLPKGYRITGYTLVLANDLVGANLGGDFSNLNSNQELQSATGNDYGTMRFYETKSWETDKTNSGSNGRDGNGYNANQVRYLELGTGWDYDTNTTTGGTIGTASEDVLATAEYNGDTDINPSDSGKKFTISRTSTDANPMGNQLYFRLVKDYCFYGLTIESFEIRFTAEGTFEADVVPSSVGKATSVVRSPFKTNKIDIGEMTNNTQQGTSNTAFSYKWEKIQDLDAYNYLYQQDAVANGVPADVAENKHICPVKVNDQLLYALGNDTYYIETPVEIVNHGNAAPIGYRIVGARFNYLYGEYSPGETHESITHHYITYESGGTTYYLDEMGHFIADEASAADWKQDNNGNIYCGDTYLGCSGNGNDRTLTAASNAGNLLSMDGNGHLYYQRYNGTYLYLHGTTSASATPTVTNDQNGLAAWTTEVEEGYTTPAFDPGAYKLEIYNREGTAVEKTVTVNSSADIGVYDMGYCNNDAIKFKISGLEEGKQALVSVTLFLQALNPYIDKMDIVCHDARNVLSLTQSFTADNFSVAGDKFIFYVPADYGNEDLTFTFSNLYSKYGDDTYYDHSKHGYGRYSFVRSPYFIPVDGSDNDGLYDSAYSPDAPYNNKVYTSKAGKYRFKFNNAEDLANQQSGQGGYFEEYPFSVSTYLNTANPGDPTATPAVDPSTDKGTFIDCVLNASKTDQKSGTYYVFTADETRWNIAPTTAWQHRYYAFYRMEIELRAKTFNPKFDWEKIYTKTFYNDGTEDKEDSMWGLKLDTTDPETGQKVEGYLTYQEIIDHIKGREETLWKEGDVGLPSQAAIGTVKWEAIDSSLDPNNETAPASMKQILYIDGTPLYAMLNSSQYSQVKTLEDLKNELNPNTLVFLPENTTSTLDNVAYKTASGTFSAGKDIVLTDKLPFYTPYDIQVDAANYATYTRLLTQPDYAQAVNATVMLPFTLSLEDGVHTNDDGKCSFTVNTMETGAQMATVGSSSVNYGTAYFKPVTASTTEANKPYMIKVERIDESVSNGNKISFIATQKGSSIVKTIDPEKEIEFVTLPVFSGKLIQGETAQAKYGDDNYDFANYASYSGGKFDRAVSEDVFYFSKNKYVDLHTLYPGTQQYLMSYPFRGVYTYNTSASGAKLMKGFFISYDLDEMESAGFTTRLKELGTKADMMIRSGKGFITITATADQKFTIRSLNGMTFRNVSVDGGNTTTVSLPAGIYIVNNTKITVK